MRIATWNIKGVRHREQLLLEWLCVRRPDLVALQKINAQEEEFPYRAFRCAGYHVEVHGSPPIPTRNYGVAILSRRKPRVLWKGLPGREGFGPRLLTVEVDGLEFSSVYAPFRRNNLAGSKLEWFESLKAHFAATRHAFGRRVLCGDFNVIPASRSRPSERADWPNRHKDIRAKFSELCNAAGLDDLYLHADPPAGWSNRFELRSPDACIQFSRLEYVLGTQGMVELNPVVWFDIEHTILENSIFPWVRAPIIADLDD